MKIDTFTFFVIAFAISTLLSFALLLDHIQLKRKKNIYDILNHDYKNRNQILASIFAIWFMFVLIIVIRYFSV